MYNVQSARRFRFCWRYRWTVTNKQHLQDKTFSLNSYLKEAGLKINTTKTKVMTINTTKTKIPMYNSNVKPVLLGQNVGVSYRAIYRSIQKQLPEENQKNILARENQNRWMLGHVLQKPNERLPKVARTMDGHHLKRENLENPVPLGGKQSYPSFKILDTAWDKHNTWRRAEGNGGNMLRPYIPPGTRRIGEVRWDEGAWTRRITLGHQIKLDYLVMRLK